MLVRISLRLQMSQLIGHGFGRSSQSFNNDLIDFCDEAITETCESYRLPSDHSMMQRNQRGLVY